jgi:hypothetical protein
MSLTEAPVADPYLKDYDAIEGEGPEHWAKRFDISNWGAISAYRDGARVGGAGMDQAAGSHTLVIAR